MVQHSCGCCEIIGRWVSPPILAFGFWGWAFDFYFLILVKYLGIGFAILLLAVNFLVFFLVLNSCDCCEIIGKWVSPPSFGGETKEMML